MQQIEKNLGRALCVKDVATYLNLDEATVRHYYHELGGIRLGRRYRFFERRIIDAIQNRSHMESPSEAERKKKRENIQDEEGGDRMGIRDEDKNRKRLVREDRHDLFG